MPALAAVIWRRTKPMIRNLFQLAPRILTRVTAAMFFCCLMSADLARGGDWPQILGPHRDGRAADGERLAGQWPKAGPTTLWQHKVGSGLAGVAVGEGRVIVFHRLEDEEIVEALDAATGKPLWKAGFPVQYVSSISEDDGPRCVPLIDEDRVFVLGASGNLHCVAADSGKTLWSRPAYKEFQAPEGYFGAGSSPIVDGDKLIVNIGGRKGAGLVAFDVKTGKTVWQVSDEQASYSSPQAVTLDGQRHLVFVTRLNVVSIDPDHGKVRFRFPFGSRGPTVNAATPLILDGHVFVSASYGVGAALAKIEKNGATQVWANDEVMSSQYATCVFHEGYLYGIDGREDVGVGRLRCFDPKTGKVVWTEDNFGMATLILADGKLVIVKTDGELALATPSPQAYRLLAEAKAFSSTTRALPALANGRLYVRDTQTLKCLDLGSSEQAD